MQDQITYLILAGGRGQRMDGIDKGLMQWQQKPMIEHILNHLKAPSERVIISANRNIEIYQQYSRTIIKDQLDDYQGPLAGILSAMQVCTTPYLLCIPCDTPAPPANILEQLWQCMQAANKSAALCHDGDRIQPLFSLISCQHEQLLSDFLQQGRRKVHDFMNLIEPAICDFTLQKNSFKNFNRPADMKNMSTAK